MVDAKDIPKNLKFHMLAEVLACEGCPFDLLAQQFFLLQIDYFYKIYGSVGWIKFNLFLADKHSFNEKLKTVCL